MRACRSLVSLLVSLAGGTLSAQAIQWPGRWVNVDPTDMAMFVLVFESGSQVHQLMPAPQFEGKYQFATGRLVVRMSDGSVDSGFVLRRDTLVHAPDPAVWVRAQGASAQKGSVLGTWAPVGPAPMEMFMTFRSDGQVVLEVGFPTVATSHADTLQLATAQRSVTSYTVRQSGDTLHVLDAKGKDRRFVRRPWGCLGIGNFDTPAPECRK